MLFAYIPISSIFPLPFFVLQIYILCFLLCLSFLLPLLPPRCPLPSCLIILLQTMSLAFSCVFILLASFFFFLCHLSLPPFVPAFLNVLFSLFQSFPHCWFLLPFPFLCRAIPSLIYMQIHI